MAKGLVGGDLFRSFYPTWILPTHIQLLVAVRYPRPIEMVGGVEVRPIYAAIKQLCGLCVHIKTARCLLPPSFPPAVRPMVHCCSQCGIVLWSASILCIERLDWSKVWAVKG